LDIPDGAEHHMPALQSQFVKETRRTLGRRDY